MNFYHFLLLTAAALLTCCDGVDTIHTSAVTSSTTFTGRTTNTEQRSLRSEAAAGNDDAEERASLWKKVVMPVKLNLWLRAGKSDDFVKSALGMKTLSGAALKTHPNYKKFLNFQLTKWYKSEKLTTYDAWVRLKLNELPGTSGEGYSAYFRYVNIFDDNAIRALKAGRTTPQLVSSTASKAEMLERATIWGVVGRSDDYVLKALGMNGLSAQAMLRHANSEIYEKFTRVRLEMM